MVFCQELRGWGWGQQLWFLIGTYWHSFWLTNGSSSTYLAFVETLRRQVRGRWQFGNKTDQDSELKGGENELARVQNKRLKGCTFLISTAVSLCQNVNWNLRICLDLSFMRLKCKQCACKGLGFDVNEQMVAKEKKKAEGFKLSTWLLQWHDPVDLQQRAFWGSCLDPPIPSGRRLTASVQLS